MWSPRSLNAYIFSLSRSSYGVIGKGLFANFKLLLVLRKGFYLLSDVQPRNGRVVQHVQLKASNIQKPLLKNRYFTVMQMIVRA